MPALADKPHEPLATDDALSVLPGGAVVPAIADAPNGDDKSIAAEEVRKKVHAALEKQLERENEER